MQRCYTRINWQNEPSTSSPINDTNLNKMDAAIYEIDGRVVGMDTSKANQSDLLQSLKTVSYNTQTGVFTFTHWNGTTQTVDLNIEKIPVSFSMSPQGVITMTTADGTTFTADVSSLIKTYTFTDSANIDFTVTTDASGNKTVVATVIDGSITSSKIDPTFAGQIADAEDHAEDAEAWAVGKRNGVDVPSTDPAYHNNSKYYSEQSVHTTFASLTDVDMTGVQDGQVPVWNATAQKYKPGQGRLTNLVYRTVVDLSFPLGVTIPFGQTVAKSYGYTVPTGYRVIGVEDGMAYDSSLNVVNNLDVNVTNMTYNSSNHSITLYFNLSNRSARQITISNDGGMLATEPSIDISSVKFALILFDENYYKN